MSLSLLARTLEMIWGLNVMEIHEYTQISQLIPEKKFLHVGFLKLQKFYGRFLPLFSVQNVITCSLVGHVNDTCMKPR